VGLPQKKIKNWRIGMRTSKVFLALAALSLSSVICRADDFSFTGTFTNINDVQEFVFTVAAPSTVTLVSYSYAGGVNSAGTVIPEGGFDPILALFSGTGPSAVYIGQDDDGGGNVPADSVTGQHYDTYLQETIAAGTYTATIQDYANFAVGPTLGDGFTGGALTGGTFIDATGANRNGNWAFDVDGVDSASAPGQPGTSPVPEPSSIALFGSGLAGLLTVVRRRVRA
jgi:hypothetical protein